MRPTDARLSHSLPLSPSSSSTAGEHPSGRSTRAQDDGGVARIQMKKRRAPPAEPANPAEPHRIRRLAELQNDDGGAVRRDDGSAPDPLASRPPEPRRRRHVKKWRRGGVASRRRMGLQAAAMRNPQERNTRLENMSWRIWNLAQKKKQERRLLGYLNVVSNARLTMAFVLFSSLPLRLCPSSEGGAAPIQIPFFWGNGVSIPKFGEWKTSDDAQPYTMYFETASRKRRSNNGTTPPPGASPAHMNTKPGGHRTPPQTADATPVKSVDRASRSRNQGKGR